MVTVITKTIGAGGGYDYATFTAAEADVENVATTAFGSTDLVANDGAIVFEAVAGTYAGSTLYFQSSLTTDPTRNVTYKPAAGSEHGGVFGAGVFIDRDAIVRDSHTVLDGVGGSNQIIAQSGAAGVIIRNGIWRVFDTQANGAGTAAHPTVLENCLFYFAASNSVTIRNGASSPIGYYRVVNCTAINVPAKVGFAVSAAVTTLEVEFTNCIALGAWGFVDTSGGTAVITGSNNFDDGNRPFPPAIQGTPYPITATTDVDPGPGDWAIYDAATGALIDDPDNDVLAGGIGPDANPLVPTTDIVGNTRSGATTDPGAFEISTLAPPEPALITIMRQIYQQDASFSVGASSEGVEKITHQLGPASADYFTINSTTSATVSVPRTAHALRVICVVASKACDVTLDLDASNSVFLGSIGGVASVQTDLTYFWSFGQVVSDGTYPRVRIVNDGFAGDQLVYLWWHLA